MANMAPLALIAFIYQGPLPGRHDGLFYCILMCGTWHDGPNSYGSMAITVIIQMIIGLTLVMKHTGSRSCDLSNSRKMVS